jgi:hypothetical protein
LVIATPERLFCSASQRIEADWEQGPGRAAQTRVRNDTWQAKQKDRRKAVFLSR